MADKNPWTGQEALDLNVANAPTVTIESHDGWDSWNRRSDKMLADIHERIKTGTTSDARVVAVELVGDTLVYTDICMETPAVGGRCVTVEQPFDNVTTAQSAFGVLADNMGGVALFDNGVAFTANDGDDTYSYLNFVYNRKSEEEPNE